MKRWPVAFLLVAAACGVRQEPVGAGIDPDSIAAHVRFLSHDLLEGRGVGGRGEALTVEYLAAQLAGAGAAPAGENGHYFQRVPLVGVEAQPGSRLRLAGREAVWLDEFVGADERQAGRQTFDAEIVYVGHGIAAPEFGWDDYKGVDVRGKVLLLFTNEPPSEDGEFFGGPALTYYGRWSFKYEEAARRGALGVLIVHTDETAGYPWAVVRNSWGGRQLYVEAQEGEAKLALAGWLHAAAAERLFEASPATRGKSLAELLALANRKDFQPIPLQVRASGDLRSSVVPLETRNVLARFEGSDPSRRDEAVLYTAHWDHLGIRASGGSEDSLYNGAVDNATGCSVLLEIARAYGRLAERPPRTILFAFVGAEEDGLLGSAYYSLNPATPVGRTAVNLNYDGLFPFGLTSDFSLPGYERTTLREAVETLAAEFGVVLTPDEHPEQGYYYRSDHFSLAKQGVPAFSLKTGTEVIGRPEGWGSERVNEYRSRHYHQPTDEFQEDWDFAGVAELARFGFELGRLAASQADLPTWREGDEFLAARQRSWD